MDYNELTIVVENMLRKSISDDYVGSITTTIIDDVIDDIETSADDNYNTDDVKLAIGRVLMNRLGIEC